MTQKSMMLIHLPQFAYSQRNSSFLYVWFFQKNVKQQFELLFLTCRVTTNVTTLSNCVHKLFFILKGCLFKATGGQCKKGNFGESTTFGWCGKWYLLHSPLFLRAGKKLPVKIEGLCKWIYFPSHFP